jgi:hypothetical protein
MGRLQSGSVHSWAGLRYKIARWKACLLAALIGPPHPGLVSAMALSGDRVGPRKYRSAGIKCREMIRVVLTDEASDAIASTLPKGAARWPMQRDRGQCFIQVEARLWSTALGPCAGPARATGTSSSGSSNWRRGGGGHEVAAKDDARSDRRGVADDGRVAAPRCAREEPL